MKWIGSLFGVGSCLALLAGVARADGPMQRTNYPSQPGCGEPRVLVPPGCGTPVLPGMPSVVPPGGPTPGGGGPGGMPPGGGAQETPPMPDTTGAGALAQAPEAGGLGGGGANPSMFGDLLGVSGNRVIVIRSSRVTGQQFISPSSPSNVFRGNTNIIVAPLPVRTAFKISEFESPRPENRVYFNYNFYDNVGRQFRLPGAPVSDFHRETIGFEYAMGDNRDFSFGMRLPFDQLEGNRDIENTQISDLSLVAKYALYNDRSSGNLLSTGMVLTLPTGPALQVPGQSALHSTIFQPFIGFVYNFENAYVLGFSSVAVPTDIRDITFLFNDLQIGYWLYRDNAPSTRITGIVPVFEMHVDTPLNHAGIDHAPLASQDAFNLTTGVYVLCRRAVVGVAAGVPLVGPKPFDYELNANISFRW
jgi:hypothetical protein